MILKILKRPGTKLHGISIGLFVDEYRKIISAEGQSKLEESWSARKNRTKKSRTHCPSVLLSAFLKGSRTVRDTNYLPARRTRPAESRGIYVSQLTFTYHGCQRVSCSEVMRILGIE